MRDKRPVDELSIEELERILAIRKREERRKRLRRYDDRGRRLPVTLGDDAPPAPEPALPPQQHEAAIAVPSPEPPVTYDTTDELPRFEDEGDDDLVLPIRPRRPDPPAVPAPGGPSRSRARSAWDKLLLAIEVIGVAGIVMVLAYGGYLIATENSRIEALDQKSAEIQQEAAALRASPTPRPELTIDLAEYVLPGGHYSPTDSTRAGEFNLDELPPSIRPAAETQLTAPRAALPTPHPSSPTRIVIPAIDVDAAIYGGDDWYALQKGVGHYLNSANPGENGNMVLTAHNDVYGEIFRYLEDLEAGDEVRIQADNGKWYTYHVRETHIVKPSDTWVLGSQNQPTVTLITCHPYRVDNQRFVVFADLVGESF